MPMRGRRVWGILAVVLLIAPFVVLAQEGRRGDRGDIQVTNDWENTVRVTLWKERGGQMSRRTWTIPQGQSAVLAGEDGRSLRVGGNDKIKVGDDWGRVDIRTVGQRQDGIWNVSVRDVWRATHQGRGRSGLPPDQPGTALPPDRR
jgi:hypothetical protein